MPPHPASDERSLELQAGEVRLTWLAAGTRVIVIDGAVRLEGPPDWLGETPHLPSVLLAAGDDRVLEKTGWVRLSARRRCSLACIAPAPGRAFGWLAWWRGFSAGADGSAGSRDC